MKKLTLSLDDTTWRRARIEAARRNQSVSAMVREYLQSLGADAGTEQRLRRLFTALDRSRGFRAANRLSRAEVHERKRIS